MANTPEYQEYPGREAFKALEKQDVEILLRALHKAEILNEQEWVILWSSIPELASLWLEALRDEGSSEPYGTRLRWVTQDPATTKAPIDEPPYPDACSVRLANGQAVWLRLNAKEVTVLDKPPRTDRAILLP